MGTRLCRSQAVHSSCSYAVEVLLPLRDELGIGGLTAKRMPPGLIDVGFRLNLKNDFIVTMLAKTGERISDFVFFSIIGYRALYSSLI